ncbi:MAG TPA: hypothetical protein VJW73_04570 [Gemmatimonadaceae bacterium]|nr:hypothetical protein [Gemmatimonadaceae bacterium]
MPEPTTAASYPYSTHLNVLFDAMETIGDSLYPAASYTVRERRNAR